MNIEFSDSYLASLWEKIDWNAAEKSCLICRRS